MSKGLCSCSFLFQQIKPFIQRHINTTQQKQLQNIAPRVKSAMRPCTLASFLCQPAFYVISTVYYIYQLPIQTYNSVLMNISQIQHILKYVINVCMCSHISCGLFVYEPSFNNNSILVAPTCGYRTQTRTKNNGAKTRCDTISLFCNIQP